MNKMKGFWIFFLLVLVTGVHAEEQKIVVKSLQNPETCEVDYLRFPKKLYGKKFLWENDAGLSDDQYSNGMKWERTLYPDCELFADPLKGEDSTYISRSLRDLHDFLPDAVSSSNNFFGYSFGMNLYTPTDTDVDNDDLPDQLIPDDRPYSGWAYFSLSFSSIAFNDEGLPSHNSKLEVMVGALGDSAYQDRVQDAFHILIDNGLSQGWENQQEGKPGFNASFNRQRLYYSKGGHLRGELGYGYLFGTVRTELKGSLGFTYTTNSDSWVYLDKATINPSKSETVKDNLQLKSEKPFPSFKRLSFISAGVAVEPRYKFYDFFLEEDSSTGSHTYKMEDFVLDAIASVDFKVSGSQSVFAFRLVKRSKEIDTISDPHKFWQFMWNSYFN